MRLTYVVVEQRPGALGALELQVNGCFIPQSYGNSYVLTRSHIKIKRIQKVMSQRREPGFSMPCMTSYMTKTSSYKLVYKPT